MRISGGLAAPRTAFKRRVHGKQSHVKGTKSRLPVRATNEQYLAKQRHTHTHSHWQAFIIENPNYNVLQWLLKLLIITDNNYSVPNLPREEGWSNYTASQWRLHTASQPADWRSINIQRQSKTWPAGLNQLVSVTVGRVVKMHEVTMRRQEPWYRSSADERWGDVTKTNIWGMFLILYELQAHTAGVAGRTFG